MVPLSPDSEPTPGSLARKALWWFGSNCVSILTLSSPLPLPFPGFRVPPCACPTLLSATLQVGDHAIPLARNSHPTTPLLYSLSLWVPVGISFILGRSLLLCSPVLTSPAHPKHLAATPQDTVPGLHDQQAPQAFPTSSKLPASQGHNCLEGMYLHRATSTPSQSRPKMGVTGGTGKHEPVKR